MRGVRRGAGWAALTVSATLLASCGMVSALGDDDAGEQSATVAVLVPASGWQEADGAGVLAAVEAAIGATADDIGGWTVEVAAVDENGAELGDEVGELVDGDLIAVIGGLSTEAVRAVQPVLDDESVLFVSPADVDPVHTRGANPSAPLRPYRSYFRTAVGDESPAAALGRYAVTGLAASAVAVVDGGDAREAAAFADAVGAAGGEVVARGTVADVAAVVTAAEEDGARAVFVSGTSNAATETAEEVRRTGLDATLLGAAAFEADDSDSGDDGVPEGVRDGAVTATTAELDPTRGASLPSNADTGTDAGAYGAAAYDAATAVGTVLDRCLPPASSASAARRGCVGEMVQLDFAGVTGEVAFDAFGDRDGGTVAFSVLRDGRWRPVADQE
ncbi:ABC transporter substrate-binding protein [Jiangella asiatica]|uniref:Amino acid ABC transporter substrate-binding protein n=1 Tax=Jiangella asiatica TaxID=2530372 RepID=A0A4R5CLQ2_9ACTN|nr:ABC transporter substrate-binding protein [Jiangella asiatica]TDE00197.1 amino acid ABC transporter substrate-binding protein [Jiangella asiatica]